MNAHVQVTNSLPSIIKISPIVFTTAKSTTLALIKLIDWRADSKKLVPFTAI